MTPTRSRVRQRAPDPDLPITSSLRLQVVYRSPGELKAAPRQLRRHPQAQIDQLCANLRRFGIVLPLLVTRDGTILNGHAVWAAAKALDLAEVPTVCIDHLSEAEESALRISLNRLQELSAWDDAALRLEIEILTATDISLLGHTGFSTPQLDLIMNPGATTADRDEEDDPPPPGPAVTRTGDLWLFEGGHRLLCADARAPESYATLMAGEQAGLVVGDLPYNVPIAGHVSGQKAMREFAMASGEMSSEAFTAFLAAILGQCATHSRDGSLHLQFMDWRHMPEMLAAGHAVYDELKNLCVWSKDNAGMGSLWRSQHELCFVWKRGRAPHVNNVELGRHGRYRTNVWSYPGANSVRGREDAAAAGHPTPKSVAMIMDAIMDVSRPGDVALDPTCGSGTTLVAAHRTRRRGYGLEIDPVYVDAVVRRLEILTGAPARLEATGRTYAETAEARADEHAPAARDSDA